MNVNRKKIILDRGTVIVVVTEALSPQELASFDIKRDKVPQSYILIGPDEEHLARIEVGMELAILMTIMQSLNLLNPNLSALRYGGNIGGGSCG